MLGLLRTSLPELLKILVAFLKDEIQGHLLADAVVQLEDVLETTHFLVDAQLGLESEAEGLEFLLVAVEGDLFDGEVDHCVGVGAGVAALIDGSVAAQAEPGHSVDAVHVFEQVVRAAHIPQRTLSHQTVGSWQPGFHNNVFSYFRLSFNVNRQGHILLLILPSDMLKPLAIIRQQRINFTQLIGAIRFLYITFIHYL